MAGTTIITDTSVLVNFLVLDEIALLSSVPNTRIAITEHVRTEITGYYAEQLTRLNAALEHRLIEEIVVDDLQELSLFARYSESGLGLGECSAMAAAVHRGASLATDDKKAQKLIRGLEASVRVESTETLMLALIRSGVLTVERADRMMSEWATKYRFRLPFESFRGRAG